MVCDEWGGRHFSDSLFLSHTLALSHTPSLSLTHTHPLCLSLGADRLVQDLDGVRRVGGAPRRILPLLHREREFRDTEKESKERLIERVMRDREREL